VLNQYQRRADLIPNIVATVKGEANFEQETLTQVIEARAKATSIQVTPEMLNDPAAMQKFQAAQGEVGSALSRLMVVVEQYPNLKANQGFSRPAGAARRHREPHHRGPQPLHPDGAGLQRARAQLPHQPHRHGVRLQAQGQLQVENEAAISAPPKVDFNKK
jgi:LemA protein